MFFDPFFLLLPLLAFLFLTRVLSGTLRAGYRRRLEARPTQTPESEEARRRATAGRFESRVFGLAYRLGGTLSVSDVVIETGLGAREAEAVLDSLTDEVHVRVAVMDEGAIRYEFPEIVERLRREGK
jgi:hypothetical protein